MIKLPPILPSSNKAINSDRPMSVKLGRKIILNEYIYILLYNFIVHIWFF